MSSDSMPDPNAELPPASLSMLISNLATQALVALGQIPNPATNQTEKHLALAKHLIDTIVVLEEKTEGNRSEDESKLLEGALHHLRMIFVSAK